MTKKTMNIYALTEGEKADAQCRNKKVIFLFLLLKIAITQMNNKKETVLTDIWDSPFKCHGQPGSRPVEQAGVLLPQSPR